MLELVDRLASEASVLFGRGSSNLSQGTLSLNLSRDAGIGRQATLRR